MCKSRKYCDNNVDVPFNPTFERFYKLTIYWKMAWHFPIRLRKSIQYDLDKNFNLETLLQELIN